MTTQQVEVLRTPSALAMMSRKAKATKAYQCNTALLFKVGRTQLHMVVMDPMVRVRTAPLDDLRLMQPLQYKGKPYPVRRAVRRFLEAGKTIGITDGARKVLQAVREAAKEDQ